MDTHDAPNHALQRPAGASRLQSLRPVGRVAELPSLDAKVKRSTIAAAILTLLSLANATVLYWHQIHTDYWLPRTDGGKWRYALVHRWIEWERERLAQESARSRYNDLSPSDRQTVDRRVSEKYPPDQVEELEARNGFLVYVGGPGMFQFPLCLAAVITSVFSTIASKKGQRTNSAVLITTSTGLFVDAMYRSYFGALGW